MLAVDFGTRLNARFFPGAVERVTIKGRHTGYSSTGVVYRGKVILVLDGCEVVR